jgi:hypothetical protein
MGSRPSAAVGDGRGVTGGEGDGDTVGLGGAAVVVALDDGDGPTDAGVGPLAHPAASSATMTRRRITAPCAL